jgi:hypothetical protein
VRMDVGGGWGGVIADVALERNDAVNRVMMRRARAPARETFLRSRPICASRCSHVRLSSEFAGG